MDPAIILALIVNLYDQLLKTQQENAELKAALVEQAKGSPADQTGSP
jgi:hypothetical protein